MKIAITRSKSGLPCLWEEGGACTNTGGAACLANPDGTPPRAIYIVSHGPRACGDHALIPIHKGMLRCDVDWSRMEGESIELYEYTGQIVSENDKEYAMFTDTVSGDLSRADDLINATKAKAHDYHCRETYYCVSPPRK